MVNNSPWLTLGRHSYCTDPIQLFEPIVYVGHFTAISNPCTFTGKRAQHPSVINRDLVANYPFNDVPFGTVNRIEYPVTGGEKDIFIGNDVWIGYDCLIKGGVKIGDGAIIGTRAVVTKEIPPYAIAVGNPCVVKKFRFGQDIIDKLLKIKWWNWTDAEIIQRMPDFLNINTFIEKYGGK